MDASAHDTIQEFPHCSGQKLSQYMLETVNSSHKKSLAPNYSIRNKMYVDVDECNLDSNLSDEPEAIHNSNMIISKSAAKQLYKHFRKKNVKHGSSMEYQPGGIPTISQAATL